MIVFLDIKSKTVKVYSRTGETSIPFRNIQKLNKFKAIGNEVLYITDAIKTDIDDIVNLVEESYGKKKNIINKDDIWDSEEALFVRSSSRSNIVLSDLDLELKGLNDFKSLSDLIKTHGEKNMKNNRIFNQLLDSGKIEILTLNEVHEEQSILDSENREREDAAMNSMLVSGSEPGSAAAYADGDIAADDAIVIDMTNELKGSGTRRLDSSSSNERGLLPNDF
jgi:hypothetical protein